MQPYSPRKVRPWVAATITIKSLIYLLKHWKLLLLALMIFSPVTPHVKVSYTFHNYTLRPKWSECKYLGVRGFVHALPGGACPPIALIDTRKYQTSVNLNTPQQYAPPVVGYSI